MGAARPRTAAVIVAVALAALVASGCEPLTTAGVSPTDGLQGSNASTHRKPATKSQIPEFRSLLEHWKPTAADRRSGDHETRLVGPRGS